MNIPENAGESAAYIFQLPPVNFAAIPLTLSINFPSHFAVNLGSSITCGVVMTSNQTLFKSQINYATLFTVNSTFNGLYYYTPCSS